MANPADCSFTADGLEALAFVANSSRSDRARTSAIKVLSPFSWLTPVPLSKILDDDSALHLDT